MEWNVWIYQTIYADKAVSSLLKCGIAFDDSEIIPHLAWKITITVGDTSSTYSFLSM